MRDDFCVFILTHGRPDRVYTFDTLKRSGYTGKVYIVIDDEDKTEAEYRARFGDKVLQFCKADIAKRIDEGDNFDDRRAIIYARNACFDLARQVGCQYFMELDDDYQWFAYRFGPHQVTMGVGAKHQDMDVAVLLLLDFFISTPALTVAMSQGGDHIGGVRGNRLLRKAMNSFVCSVNRPFEFSGRINEDVNTYTSLSRVGQLFLTVLPIQLCQLQTQTNAGGMAEMYLDSGTYMKSFYPVMYCPSSVQIGMLRDPQSDYGRIHHKINWHKTAPKILDEQWKKVPCG